MVTKLFLSIKSKFNEMTMEMEIHTYHVLTHWPTGDLNVILKM